jgi:hypothetical protein
MFDLDRFVVRCKTSVAAGEGQRGIREIMKEAVRDPGAIVDALGEPTRAGVATLYRGDDLTIVNLVWGPRMTAHGGSSRRPTVCWTAPPRPRSYSR